MKSTVFMTIALACLSLVLAAPTSMNQPEPLALARRMGAAIIEGSQPGSNPPAPAPAQPAPAKPAPNPSNDGVSGVTGNPNKDDSHSTTIPDDNGNPTEDGIIFDYTETCGKKGRRTLEGRCE